MEVRTYKDEERGKVGIILMPEFCAEEEQLIKELLGKGTQIVVGKSFNGGLALVKDRNKFSPFSAVENSKGKRFHLNPFVAQHED